MKKIIFVWIFCLLAVSCDDRLEEMNQERVNPAEVPGETLFANGVKELADMMTNSSVNENVFRLYAQYWAQVTYVEEMRYNQVSRNIPRNWGWGIGYRQALRDLTSGRELMAAEPDPTISDAANANKLAITDIAIAYVYAVMAETYGNIPYTEALDVDNITPVYDDAKTVYYTLIDIITDAANTLDVDDVAFPDNQDPIYFGDVAGWKMFANSLKLRMAMMIADIDPGKAQTMIDEALASGVIVDPANDASITYYSQAPSTNPIYEDLVLAGRNDYVPANTIVDLMNDLNDPRRDVYFDGKINGEYEGGIYGDNSNFIDVSHLGVPFYTPTLPGVLMNCSEVMFLLAEAAERGFTVPETAESYYNKGIEFSMMEWGLTQADYDAYIAQPAVAYATAAGDWKQKIGIQSWLALNNRGYEGWTTWRRLDFDGFNVPNIDPPITKDDIPVRLLYPQEEANLNGANLDAAISAIGGNLVTTKLWWDVN